MVGAIYRSKQQPRLSAARAAGALPARFVVTLHMLDADGSIAFFGNSCGLEGEHAAEVAALSERLFLEPADSAGLPYAIRVCSDEYDDGQEMQLCAAFAKLRVPCGRCGGGALSTFYFADSPTWVGLSKKGNANSRAPGSAAPLQCMCKRCAWCDTPSACLRACGACMGLSYCSTACQKLAWPAHKEMCRAAAAAAKRG